MKNIKLLNLQLFADGDGGGEGATSGENATVDAGQRLRELGVPEDKIRRRAKYAAKPAESAVQTEQKAETATETTEKDAASDNPTEETKTAATPDRMSWDEIMADPEYNKQMQRAQKKRLPRLLLLWSFLQESTTLTLPTLIMRHLQRK